MEGLEVGTKRKNGLKDVSEVYLQYRHACDSNCFVSIL